MIKRNLLFLFASLLLGIMAAASPAVAQIDTDVDRPLRIIAVFAHPDDGDVKMGGTAALLAKAGYAVKFVSITNGDAGHHQQGGGVLAKRRRAEAEEAARRFGIEEYKVLDNHDGELLPQLHIRQQVIREIRNWDADVVIGLRPNDYHPDHRYAGVLVQDAAYMVVVPNVVSDTPPLTKNPVFFYMSDRFQKPNPFSHDIVVAIDEVIDQKIHALDAHESQVYEWLPWVAGYLDQVPEDESKREAWLKERWGRFGMSDAQRKGLEKWYGSDQAKTVEYAESFEICEYGHQPNEEELRKIFPMLGTAN